MPSPSSVTVTHVACPPPTGLAPADGDRARRRAARAFSSRLREHLVELVGVDPHLGQLVGDRTAKRSAGSPAATQPATWRAHSPGDVDHLATVQLEPTGVDPGDVEQLGDAAG